jgi:hypothetical protein
MFIKVFSLAILFTFKVNFSFSSFNSSEICFRPNEFENKCLGKHIFRCDFETCTTNKTICENFEIMKKLAKFDYSPFAFQTKIYEFSLFLKQIKSCPYTWDTSDLCIRASKCTHIHEFKFKEGILSIFEKIPCSCYKLGFQFDCKDYNYCGKDLNSCKGLETFKSNYNKINYFI